MRMNEQAVAGIEAGTDRFAAMELELALDRQESDTLPFETCVRQAAEMIGGEVLFDMPADGSFDDASRIAAIRVSGAAGERIVFAILDTEGETIRVVEREEIGERFYGFARAFVGVLTRIRDDLTFVRTEPEGTA